MSVKDLGYEVTGGPGIDYGRVTANDEVGATIELKLTAMNAPIGFGFDELTQFIEHLQVLQSCADKLLINNRQSDRIPGGLS